MIEDVLELDTLEELRLVAEILDSLVVLLLLLERLVHDRLDVLLELLLLVTLLSELLTLLFVLKLDHDRVLETLEALDHDRVLSPAVRLLWLLVELLTLVQLFVLLSLELELLLERLVGVWLLELLELTFV